MKIDLLTSEDLVVASLSPEHPGARETGDFLDLMAEAGSMGASALVINKNQLPTGFFELSNGMAGEILQKFSNYRFRLAIVGDFSGINSRSLKDFIRESNRSGRIMFVESPEEATIRWRNFSH